MQAAARKYIQVIEDGWSSGWYLRAATISSSTVGYNNYGYNNYSRAATNREQYLIKQIWQVIRGGGEGGRERKRGSERSGRGGGGEKKEISLSMTHTLRVLSWRTWFFLLSYHACACVDVDSLRQAIGIGENSCRSTVTVQTQKNIPKDKVRSALLHGRYWMVRYWYWLEHLCYTWSNLITYRELHEDDACSYII